MGPGEDPWTLRRAPGNSAMAREENSPCHMTIPAVPSVNYTSTNHYCQKTSNGSWALYIIHIQNTHSHFNIQKANLTQPRFSQLLPIIPQEKRGTEQLPLLTIPWGQLSFLSSQGFHGYREMSLTVERTAVCIWRKLFISAHGPYVVIEFYHRSVCGGGERKLDDQQGINLPIGWISRDLGMDVFQMSSKSCSLLKYLTSLSDIVSLEIHLLG